MRYNTHIEYCVSCYEIASRFEIDVKGKGNILENLSASVLLERIKESLGLSSDVALAEVLGVAQNTISGWKSRNAISPILERLVGVEGLSLDQVIGKSQVAGDSSPNVGVALGSVAGTHHGDNVYGKKHIGSSVALDTDLYKVFRMCVESADTPVKKTRLKESLKALLNEFLE